MLAARLHGPHDIRLDDVQEPGKPGAGEVLLRVTAAGICGSDLHTYQDGRIGETTVSSPLVLGHEFAGVVEECATGVRDGSGLPLTPGTRVAVDPATPCGVCEMCRSGNPHLCRKLHFCGHFPDDGCFRQRMIVSGQSCFLVPPTIDNASGALLEPLGIALHAVKLSYLKPSDTVCILGAGPIGLMIYQVVRLSVSGPVFVTEPLPWRLALARRLGAQAIDIRADDPVESVLSATAGRGVDVAIEAAWADESIQEAAAMARPGGRVVLVGIPRNDLLQMKHSNARRKELTIQLSRRMKQTYPEAISLVAGGKIDLQCIVSHRLPLTAIHRAFSINAAYEEGVVKVIIEP